MIKLFLIIITVCTSNIFYNLNNKKDQVLSKNNVEQESKINQKTRGSIIRNVVGLLVVKENYTKNDTVKFYNVDGSIWYKFTFFYDDSDGKFEYEYKEFQPYGFNPDYFLLVLEVINKDSFGYEVIVNRDKNLKKRIKDEPFLQFLTWENYVLSVFSISFDNMQNPIHIKPNNESAIITFQKDTFYHPVSIQGDWLQIKWGEENNWKFGWIKWKSNDRLIIDIHSYA